MYRQSKEVKIGSVAIGGTAPVCVQSMTNTDTMDFEATTAQLLALERAGCAIARIAVPKIEAAEVFSYAKSNGVEIPLVADIHFDYRIALAAVKAGADKIRINPGNIGAAENVRAVAEACGNAGLPIRIGVNGGSLERSLIEKYGSPTPEALCESALTQASMLEEFGFTDTVISIKSSRVADMIAANRLVRERSDYPIHIGVTEAGDEYSGLVKNACGIGALLCDGIGDTLRVSLTADPVKEVVAGHEILRAMGLENGFINIVSCPTCGRTKIDLISLSAALRESTAEIDTHGKNITVALMGCVVNGPGEAREADVGIAGGDGCGVLIRHGEVCGRVSEAAIIPTLVAEIKKIIGEVDVRD